jgi:hypothetical protein
MLSGVAPDSRHIENTQKFGTIMYWLDVKKSYMRLDIGSKHIVATRVTGIESCGPKSSPVCHYYNNVGSTDPVLS